jgi:hypothetical protein
VRVLHLYRPRLPELRAQAVQVLHTCHALAARGHEVTLLADRALGFDGDATEALERYGLNHPPSLDLRLAPTAWPPGAGLWFRAAVAGWCARSGRDAVVYARAKRYVAAIPARIPVVLEAHELDSALDREAGRDPGANLALERAVYDRAAGLVTNCAGTLRSIQDVHRVLPLHQVIWNATRADRAVPGVGGGGVAVVGSGGDYKGVRSVLLAALNGPAPVTFVGGAEDIPGVRTVGAIGYGEVPSVLAGLDVLLLPLQDNLFGRALTNPLKLWDYLATDRPIVAPDLPSIREVTEDVHFYDPRTLDTVAPAIARALAQRVRTPRLRTWEDRAAEIERFLAETLGGRS